VADYGTDEGAKEAHGFVVGHNRGLSAARNQSSSDLLDSVKILVGRDNYRTLELLDQADRIDTLNVAEVLIESRNPSDVVNVHHRERRRIGKAQSSISPLREYLPRFTERLLINF